MLQRAACSQCLNYIAQEGLVDSFADEMKQQGSSCFVHLQSAVGTVSCGDRQLWDRQLWGLSAVATVSCGDRLT